VTVTQLPFADALAQLSGIGERLKGVSDPDDVLALEAEAEALAEHCRALLRRPRALRSTPSPRPPAGGVSWPSVTADGSVIAVPEVVDVARDLSAAPAAPTETILLPTESTRSD
jgi:hypothetical protein